MTKSDSFSAPKLKISKLSVGEKDVKIHLEKPAFSGLEIEIIRSNYDTHTTLYKGAWLETFTDDTLKKDVAYVYRIIPIYKEIRGTETLSPRVFIGENTPSIEVKPPPEIVEKDWWNY